MRVSMSETITPGERSEYENFKQLMDWYEKAKELAASATDPVLKEHLQKHADELAERIQEITPGFIDLENAEEAERLNKKQYAGTKES